MKNGKEESNSNSLSKSSNPRKLDSCGGKMIDMHHYKQHFFENYEYQSIAYKLKVGKIYNLCKCTPPRFHFLGSIWARLI
jgi:hypothetical protein